MSGGGTPMTVQGLPEQRSCAHDPRITAKTALVQRIAQQGHIPVAVLHVSAGKSTPDARLESDQAK